MRRPEDASPSSAPAIPHEILLDARLRSEPCRRRPQRGLKMGAIEAPYFRTFPCVENRRGPHVPISLPGRFSSSNNRIYRLRRYLRVGDRLLVTVPDRFGARDEGAEPCTRCVPGATTML